MGSFLLHDDYRLPDYNNLGVLYKKDNINAGNIQQAGMFETNLCFNNIKRGTGFGLNDDLLKNTEEDDWSYNRARSSPVVERLILQEIQNDIAEYAITIGVSMDPRQWGVEDTRKWLQWVADLYQIGDQTHCLSYDGQTLCGFTEGEFVYLTDSEDAGLKIAAQLDLWKNAVKLTSNAGAYHFQHQQTLDQKLGMNPMERNSSSPKLLDVPFSWSPVPHEYSTTSDIMPPSNQLINAGTTNTTTPATETGNYMDMRPTTSYQPYTLQNNAPVPDYPSEPQRRSTPRPTIPLDRFRSVREACQQNGFLSYEKYQEFTSITPPRHVQNMFPSTKSRIPTSSTAPNTYNIDSMGATDTQMPFTIKEELTQPASKLDIDIVPESHLRELIPEYKVDTPELKTEKVDVEINLPSEATSSKAVAEKAPKKKSSKHPIHLWEFLKQLLCDGKDCIRWIDQEKGVFKIYNSQEVAKFWGERKNRPAMNYDKLSRSIRQYYKKGIIKKTSQGKRLVYQFCQGYI